MDFAGTNTAATDSWDGSATHHTAQKTGSGPAGLDEWHTSLIHHYLAEKGHGEELSGTDDGMFDAAAQFNPLGQCPNCKFGASCSGSHPVAGPNMCGYF